MSNDVIDLRAGDRFNFTEAVPGTFGPADVTLVNISVVGVQVSHPSPLRIGTQARLVVKRGEISVAVQARVIWSHVTPNAKKLSYQSGLKLETTDVQYAAAINTLYKSGVVKRDTDSLEAKRQRIAEKEAALLKAKVKKNIPSSEPPPA